MGVDEAVLNGVVRRVLTVSSPDRIILFGSAARAEMTPDGDLDLLVLERQPLDPRERSVKIRRALGGVQYPIDVVVMPTDRFENTKHLIRRTGISGHHDTAASFMRHRDPELRAFFST